MKATTPFGNPGLQARPPMGSRAPGTINHQDLNKILPAIDDSERSATREQILETLKKDIDINQAQKLMEQNSLGSQEDRGEHSQMTPIDIIVQLETLIHSKYPDSNGQNYKGLSKKVIQSLKTKSDQRQALLDIKDQIQVEDYLQNFLFNRPAKGTQGQESAGSGASSASNPFAMQRPGAPGGPPQKKPPGGPQNRMPQQRFAAGNFFAPQTATYVPPAININEQETTQKELGAQQQLVDDSQSQQVTEQERPSVQQHNNQQHEEVKSQKDIPSYNFADSGAADVTVPTYGQDLQLKGNQQVSSKQGGSTNMFGDEFDFFQQLANTAVKQQTQQQNPSIPKQDIHEHTVQQVPQQIRSQNQQQLTPHKVYSHENQTLHNLSKSHSQQEEQSRADVTSDSHQRLEFEEQQLQQNQQEETTLTIPNNQFEMGNEVNDNDETGRRISYKEEGIIFDPIVNLEQEEGLQKTASNVDMGLGLPEVEEEKVHNNNLMDNDQAQQNPIQNEKFDYHHKESFQTEPYEQMQFDLINDAIPESRELSGSRPTKHQFSSNSKQISRNNSQLHINQNAIRGGSPSMKGFIQSYQSSRPPQSVASVNITNLEDSEGMIRAYKKKKAELDELKERYYHIETEYFTEKQKNMLLEEDLSRFKSNLSRAEKLLKEAQLKEAKKDSDLLARQLQLKSQESQSYQNELSHQKSENAKLRDKIKELMARNRGGNIGQAASTSESSIDLELHQRVIREKESLSAQLESMKQHFTIKLQESQTQSFNIQNESRATILKLENQIRQLKEQTTSTNDSKDVQIQQLQSEIHKLEDDLIAKNKEIASYQSQIEQLKAKQQQLEHHSATKKSEDENSFVNVQSDHKSPSEDQYYVGYYESNNISIHSAKSSIGDVNKSGRQQPPDYSLMSSTYFVSQDESEKQSSAPPSQLKKTNVNPFAQSQQVIQQHVQPQQQLPKQQVPQQKPMMQQPQQKQGIQSLQEAEDFFSTLQHKPQIQPQAKPMQQPQQRLPQQQQIQQQPIPSIPQQKPVQQYVQPQQQQAVKQPQQQMPPQQKLPQNMYNFTLDEISFDQSFGNQPQQKAPLNQQRPPQMQQPQQQQPQQQLPKQQLPNRQQPAISQQQQQQQKSNPYSSFEFDDNSHQSTPSSAKKNVIPSSLFE